ncbi:hypothetical protein F5Y08DRAFT_212735 [Xylaria arbuscula]|nr:hypothetical protein F5Y08DRAFT_212735 [Xylaria arbuscula]
MSAFGRWLFSRSSGSRSSDNSSPPLDTSQSIHRILHGRVTKPSRSELTPNVTKFKSSVKYTHKEENDEEEDATFTESIDIGPARPTDRGNSEKGRARKIKREVESSDSESANHDSEDARGFTAMMAQQAESKDGDDPFVEDKPDSSDDPFAESDTKSQQSAVEDQTGSEPDVSPDPALDEESDPDTAWRAEQISLNTILNARNEFTLMPVTWKMHFRGIPLPDSLFYIKTKSKSIRPRIYARTDRLEYRGALALRKLIDVHARIQDIRGDEALIKSDTEEAEAVKQEFLKTLSADIAGRLRRALEQAAEWAKQDGGIDRYGDQLPPNVTIMDLKGINQTDEPESEVKIKAEMCDLAQQWRNLASNAYEPAEPPVIFGFVIMKHIITIVTLDASDPDAIIHVPCQLHMAERNQHQWNALAILVTICWARDVLLDYISAHPGFQPEVKDESSDPDA